MLFNTQGQQVHVGRCTEGCVRDLITQTTFGGGLGQLTQFIFIFFAACVFRATLKDRLLLNLTSSMKRHEKKPQQAEWITHCLVFMWFTVMSIMCFRGLLTCRCSQQMFVNTTSVLTTERVTTTTQTPSTGRLILGVNIQLFLSPVSIDFTIYTDFMKEDNILFKANIYIFTNSVKSNHQRQLL